MQVNPIPSARRDQAQLLPESLSLSRVHLGEDVRDKRSGQQREPGAAEVRPFF